MLVSSRCNELLITTTLIARIYHESSLFRTCERFMMVVQVACLHRDDDGGTHATRLRSRTHAGPRACLLFPSAALVLLIRIDLGPARGPLGHWEAQIVSGSCAFSDNWLRGLQHQLRRRVDRFRNQLPTTLKSHPFHQLQMKADG